MAERTRLELATPGVTGRYSNQLNYRSAASRFKITCLIYESRLFGLNGGTDETPALP